MKITFVGGAETVTGANYLLEEGNKKLVIDCGLYQGEKLESKNYEDFVYNPEEIEAVFVTHAHIDHIGRIPLLVKKGFHGKIYSTYPTKDLAFPMLFDALKIMLEREKEKNIPSLYNEEDILRAFNLWEGVNYKIPIKIGKLCFTFLSAGHILGSASVLVSFSNKKLLFSGDLGNNQSPFIKPFDKVDDVNFVVMESTYGNRLHRDVKNRKQILAKFLKEAIKNKKVLIIPAFALERTQELIFELNEIVERELKQKVNVFVDGPLAFQVLEIYKKYSRHTDYFNEYAIQLQNKGDNIFSFPGLKVIFSEKESRKILDVPPPKVIIAASGMSSGGRILVHEIKYLEDPQAIFLIVGYQTKDSLGSKLLEGKKEVNILGRSVKVKAKICFTDGYSAHADKNDLFSWLSSISGSKLEKVFLVQGDKDACLNLAKDIEEKLNIKTKIPQFNEVVVL